MTHIYYFTITWVSFSSPYMWVVFQDFDFFIVKVCNKCVFDLFNAHSKLNRFTHDRHIEHMYRQHRQYVRQILLLTYQ
jgi:hypothetical protein